MGAPSGRTRAGRRRRGGRRVVVAGRGGRFKSAGRRRGQAEGVWTRWACGRCWTSGRRVLGGRARGPTGELLDEGHREVVRSGGCGGGGKEPTKGRSEGRGRGDDAKARVGATGGSGLGRDRSWGGVSGLARREPEVALFSVSLDRRVLEDDLAGGRGQRAWSATRLLLWAAAAGLPGQHRPSTRPARAKGRTFLSEDLARAVGGQGSRSECQSRV